MNKCFLIALLVGAMTAHATERMTYSYGGKVLSAGDSMARVSDIMGEPQNKEAVTNQYGAQVATNWYYTVDGKTVKVLIREGKVVSIDESR